MPGIPDSVREFFNKQKPFKNSKTASLGLVVLLSNSILYVNFVIGLSCATDKRAETIMRGSSNSPIRPLIRKCFQILSMKTP